MNNKIISPNQAMNTLKRLNCCAALLIGVIQVMQAEGASINSVMRVVGVCDLLEAIIQDSINAVESACIEEKASSNHG